jgi:hypothetical protein
VQSGEVFKILGGVFGGMKAFRERDMAFPGWDLRGIVCGGHFDGLEGLIGLIDWKGMGRRARKGSKDDSKLCFKYCRTCRRKWLTVLHCKGWKPLPPPLWGSHVLKYLSAGRIFACNGKRANSSRTPAHAYISFYRIFRGRLQIRSSALHVGLKFRSALPWFQRHIMSWK